MLHQAPESLFWYWVNERHRIYVRRAAGAPKPWTEDPVLQTYKFTNVFRQLDRGTVWLQEHFVKPHWQDDPQLLFFNCAWYRMFNWIGTGERLGWQTGWDRAKVRQMLRAAQHRGEQVFTGAHMVRSESGRPKVGSIVDVCAALWKRRQFVTAVARRTQSLQHTFATLVEVKYIGGFMAYEIVSDLRHTPLLERASDVNTWAYAGPGAMRGVLRLWPDARRAEVLPRMVGLLAASRESGVLGVHVPTLELRDIEHSLCELDKYCRVKFGEGRPRSLYPGLPEDGGA